MTTQPASDAIAALSYVVKSLDLISQSAEGRDALIEHLETLSAAILVGMLVRNRVEAREAASRSVTMTAKRIKDAARVSLRVVKNDSHGEQAV